MLRRLALVAAAGLVALQIRSASRSAHEVRALAERFERAMRAGDAGAVAALLDAGVADAAGLARSMARWAQYREPLRFRGSLCRGRCAALRLGARNCLPVRRFAGKCYMASSRDRSSETGHEPTPSGTIREVLFRVMKEAADGKPLVGSSFGTLGVRPKDVEPDSRGMVGPGTGGLSVFDTPQSIPVGFRPRAFGGQGELPLWRSPKDLPKTLRLTRNPETGHGEIVPAYAMEIDDFQRALASTRDGWTKVERPSEKA